MFFRDTASAAVTSSLHRKPRDHIKNAEERWLITHHYELTVDRVTITDWTLRMRLAFQVASKNLKKTKTTQFTLDVKLILNGRHLFVIAVNIGLNNQRQERRNVENNFHV